MKTKKTKKTKQQRRIAVIKDALQQLKIGTYVATAGTYCNIPKLSGMILAEENKDWDVEKVQAQSVLLERKDLKCEVCARGALFLSMVRKENNVLLVDIEGMACADPGHISDLFTHDEFKEIERYFEGFAEGVKFARSYEHDDERLMVILKNMLKYNGKFTPKKLVHGKYVPQPWVDCVYLRPDPND